MDKVYLYNPSFDVSRSAVGLHTQIKVKILGEIEDCSFLAPFILNETFIDRLLRDIYREDNIHGKMAFSYPIAQLFKRLFRNFGISILNLFRPKIDKICVSKQEGPQRALSEFVWGLIRGVKRWKTDERCVALRYICNILDQVHENMTMEVFPFWRQCFNGVFVIYANFRVN